MDRRMRNGWIYDVTQEDVSALLKDILTRLNLSTYLSIYLSIYLSPPQVLNTTFDNSSRQLATCSSDATAMVFDVLKCQHIATMKGHQDEVSMVGGVGGTGGKGVMGDEM